MPQSGRMKIEGFILIGLTAGFCDMIGNLSDPPERILCMSRMDSGC